MQRKLIYFHSHKSVARFEFCSARGPFSDSWNHCILLFQGCFPMLHQPGCEDQAGCILLGNRVKHFDINTSEL